MVSSYISSYYCKGNQDFVTVAVTVTVIAVAIVVNIIILTCWLAGLLAC